MSEDQATSSPTADTGEESSATENVESTPESKETQAQEPSQEPLDVNSPEVIESIVKSAKDAYDETSKMMLIEESLMMESVLEHKIHKSYYESWKQNTNDYFRLLNRFERRFREYNEIAKPSISESPSDEKAVETPESEPTEVAS